ncbi:hypothetical protein [Paenibacillus chitinolyticus]|uniref:hypothetical protein n=1 Tax=Paenibacillus chitinolyticus TaxID=79263 RepID=UPI00362E4473
MLAVTMIWLAGIALGAFQVPTLWKRRLLKDLAAFAVLLLSGLVLSTFLALSVPFPKPLDVVNFLIGRK